MKIRFAQKEDVPEVLDMCKALFAESRFRHYAFSDAKVIAAIESMLVNEPAACILLAQRSDGDLAGMLAGYATEFFFCTGVVVQDRLFYVKPEYRGSPAAIKLLLAFRQWAEQRSADELCINMSVAIDMARFNKLMTHLGFKCSGSNFSLVLPRTV